MATLISQHNSISNDRTVVFYVPGTGGREIEKTVEYKTGKLAYAAMGRARKAGKMVAWAARRNAASNSAAD